MKFRELRKLLREHDIIEDPVKGKGSHRAFRRGEDWYTVPFHGDNGDVKKPYIRELEKLFGVDLQGRAKPKVEPEGEPGPVTDLPVTDAPQPADSTEEPPQDAIPARPEAP